MKGIILAAGSGTRLYPITKSTSKQLIPVYDKPMIYYPLSVLMEAGIKDILIITNSGDLEKFKSLLGNGTNFEINIEYIIQPTPDGVAQALILGENFIGNDICAMILGDNIFCGDNLGNELKTALVEAKNGKATIFGYKVKDPERFGVLEIDNNNKVLSVEEKPQHPKSNYAITGLYVYPKGVSEKAKKIKPSKRGELEITSLNDMYLKDGLLHARLLKKGYMWFDTGTFDSLLEASNIIKYVQKASNKLVGSPELIAYKNKWINNEELLKLANDMKKNSYGEALFKIVDNKKNN